MVVARGATAGAEAAEGVSAMAVPENRAAPIAIPPATASNFARSNTMTPDCRQVLSRVSYPGVTWITSTFVTEDP
jgi:hypothetical protein